MHTCTHPTVAGTISLLLALPHLAPGPEVDVSGATVVTSRINAAPLAFPGSKTHEDEIRDLADLLTEQETIELSPEEQFQALVVFGENLLDKTYDLPSEFAAIISANLPALL